ncbi:AraC family transcriptional regulator [Marinobacter sp. CHS3-4]|uniref:AraC family transcriptional regulator n=1 Tax=Marinobacter sp. CHS3-4 TaxID=3045174 RepID=UPI0024B55E2B|nr:AraC family transcriptional regulator [Marinobacter sp. CHS3-4]MDI9243829.1 AraC family transcriptional regulator [Marinobacter sp. CHS3-4]
MPHDSSPQLLELVEPLANRDGFIRTSLAEVYLVASRRPVPRTPLIYEPSLIVIAQGQKVGYLGDRTIHYNPGQYLVQSLPLPFECETQATPDAPLLGIAVRFDPSTLSELVHETTEEFTNHEETAPLPMASVAMTEGMHEAMVRLMRAIVDPMDARVMGRGRVREVIYEALKGGQGPALRALVQNRGQYSRIVRVLQQMHAEYSREYTVEELAALANMSTSAFHQHFKEITRTSPVQYLKRFRLIKARQLMTRNQLNVNQAASAVGYLSVPQFSRDYKRYFTVSPGQHRRGLQSRQPESR